MPKKPIIFLSHIHEESAIAAALKELIETKFLKQVEVFVSSSPQSNRPGRDWQELIKQNLRVCELAIVLAGPHSINRRWINFESGAVWSRGKSVIPLCHSGIDSDSLAPPLDFLTVLRANVEDDLKLLFKEVAELLSGESPPTDFSDFLALVSNYETESQQIQEAETASPIAAIRGLLPFEFVTLALIAENNEGIGYHGLRNFAPRAGIVPLKAVLGAKMLIRKNLIREEWGDEQQYWQLFLQDGGWKWLEDNHDLIGNGPQRPPAEDGDIPF